MGAMAMQRRRTMIYVMILFGLAWVSQCLALFGSSLTRLARSSAAAALVLSAPLGNAASAMVDVQGLMRSGARSFAEGRVKESVETFREVERLRPEMRPYLWQKGIAEFAVGDFKECASQFADDLKMHPEDAEESIFLLACDYRSQETEKAQGNGDDSVLAAAANRLLSAQRTADRRAVMNTVLDVFTGQKSPDALRAFAAAADRSASPLKQQQQFYAALYLGLFSESALHDKAAASDEYSKALETDYAKGVGAGDFMVTTARVLQARLRAESDQ